MAYPSHYLNLAIGHLGLKGARDHSSYEKMVSTWIDQNEAIPTEEQCKAVFDAHFRISIVKQAAINRLSELSLNKRREIIPDYQLQNAALDIYDVPTKAQIKRTCESFRQEFYRCKALIEAATTAEQISQIENSVNYPATVIL